MTPTGNLLYVRNQGLFFLELKEPYTPKEILKLDKIIFLHPSVVEYRLGHEWHIGRIVEDTHHPIASHEEIFMNLQKKIIGDIAEEMPPDSQLKTKVVSNITISSATHDHAFVVFHTKQFLLNLLTQQLLYLGEEKTDVLGIYGLTSDILLAKENKIREQLEFFFEWNAQTNKFKKVVLYPTPANYELRLSAGHLIINTSCTKESCSITFFSLKEAKVQTVTLKTNHNIFKFINEGTKYSFEFLNDNSLLGHISKNIVIWDIRTGELVFTKNASYGSKFKVGVLNSGNILISHRPEEFRADEKASLLEFGFFSPHIKPIPQGEQEKHEDKLSHTG